MQSPLLASLCCVLSLAPSACSSSSNSGAADAGASPIADASAIDAADVGAPASADASAVDSANADAGGSAAATDGGNDASDAGVDAAPSADGGCPGGGDGGSGTFTCTGGLAVARSAPGGAVLPNGQVLVAGGWNNQTLASSAEIYDPALGTFTPTGSMDSEHYLAGWGSPWPVLANGKVLVAGGLDASGALLATAELYDPAAGTFSPTGALGTAIVSYDPVTLQDGSALFVGGYSSVTGATLTPGGFVFTGGTNQVQHYDPTSGAFASAGTVAEDRLFGCNVLLASGKVLAIGGFQGVSTTFETNIEQYDPSTTSWSTIGTLPAGAVYCSVSAFLLPSGKIFLDGSYLFDPVALSATPTTNAPPYTEETFMQLADGDVLALPPKSAAAAPNGYVYHDATGLWTEVGSPGFLGCRGFLLSSGEVLVIGGSDSNGMSQAMGMIYHP
ncbi:MAG: hypothetical protein ABSC94_15320 [Polyangiaceae bacterium]